jgi:hypothetical protein
MLILKKAALEKKLQNQTPKLVKKHIAHMMNQSFETDIERDEHHDVNKR